MPSFPRPALAGAAACFSLIVTAASADPLDVVVTSYRSATALDGAGTDITVIDRSAIEASRADTVAQILKTVPGVSLYESGGPGSQTLVMLRGANPQHTLVLIDGVKVNDPSTTSAQFDFSTLSLTDIDHIEILKGPQTALYGSDALGGVIQIFTRRAGAKPTGSVTVEAGSYNTFRSTASASGKSGPFSLAASGTVFSTDGFSRVGDRDHGEPDGSEKYAGTVSGAYDAGGGLRFDFSANADHLFAQVDGSSTLDAPGYLWNRDLLSGYGRFTLQPPDSTFKQTLTFSGIHERAEFTEPTRVTDYGADVKAAEYQGEARVFGDDTILFGGRIEDQKTSLVAPTATVLGQTDLFAGFALYRMPVGKRWEFSLGGRYDGAFGGEGFATGRFTAAYRIAETGTKFRGSIANGANRPTAYQLFHPIYGNPDLTPERSVGADIGVDQSLFGGRLTLSATGFYNHFNDLIAFNAATSKYRNLTEAETGGVALGANASLVPGVLQVGAAYTWLMTRNLSDDPAVHDKPLQRRPEHSGSITVTYTGIEKLELSATAILVGARLKDDKALVQLDPYARVDLYAAYHLAPQLTAFGRVENLFNATYHEIAGYNTPGLSAYAGLTWRE